MKKLFYVMIMALTLSAGMVLASCGNDNDEPDAPKTQNLQSAYENENDTHFMFDINLEKDSSSIYLYNVQFAIGEQLSPVMNIRIDAPVTVDKSGKVYTYAGTNIIPYMLRGNNPVPVPNLPVTDLICTVNVNNKTYSMSFDCHGGHYDNSGKLQ